MGDQSCTEQSVVENYVSSALSLMTSVTCNRQVKVKVKVKVTLEKPTKAQRESRGIALLFLQLQR